MPTLRIGIIGAGFSGTGLAATLQRLTTVPLEIFLCDKTGSFGVGDAYRTPYPFHLLNVRAKDMSAFENEPQDFVAWLNSNPEAHPHLDSSVPVSDQFVPRFLYRHYLQYLLTLIETDTRSLVKLTLVSSEVLEIIPNKEHATLVLSDHKKIIVDKVVLALGNNSPAVFPFLVSSETKCILNPWDYTAPKQIQKKDPVMIVGTGLSMIDAVLTLHQQAHEGPIYAISRHGLLPLPHTENQVPFTLVPEEMPLDFNKLTRYLRKVSEDYMAAGGDWRAVIHAFRPYVPMIWQSAKLRDKKRFLRHLTPYWNIHRHRVHHKIAELLVELMAQEQLKIFAGRVVSVENGVATVKLRHTDQRIQLKVRWLINCMGPVLGMSGQPLWHALFQHGIASYDDLNLGFAVSREGALKDSAGNISDIFYTLGPPTKGSFWECGAVPEIRKQSDTLAKALLHL
jgi:uncharacterized NAD(P)/FAD-binding protein YdhS